MPVSVEFQQFTVAFVDPDDPRLIRTHPVWTDGRRKARRCGKVLLALAYREA